MTTIEERYLKNIDDVVETMSFWKDKITAINNAGPAENIITLEDNATLSALAKLGVNELVHLRLLALELAYGFPIGLGGIIPRRLDVALGDVFLASDIATEFPTRWNIANTVTPLELTITSADIATWSNEGAGIVFLRTADDYIENSQPVTIKALTHLGNQIKLIGSDGVVTECIFDSNSQNMFILFLFVKGEMVGFMYEDMQDLTGLATYSNNNADSKLNLSLGTISIADIYSTRAERLYVSNNFGGANGITEVATSSSYLDGSVGLSMRVKADLLDNTFKGVVLPAPNIIANPDLGISVLTDYICYAKQTGDVLNFYFSDALGTVTDGPTITGLVGYTVTWAKVLVTIGGFCVIALKILKAGESKFFIEVTENISTGDLSAIIANGWNISDTAISCYSKLIDHSFQFISDDGLELLDITCTDDASIATNRISLSGEVQVPYAADGVIEIDMTPGLLNSQVFPHAWVIGALADGAGLTLKDFDATPAMLPLDVPYHANIKGSVYNTIRSAFAYVKGNELTVVAIDSNVVTTTVILAEGIKDFNIYCLASKIHVTIISNTEIITALVDAGVETTVRKIDSMNTVKLFVDKNNNLNFIDINGTIKLTESIQPSADVEYVLTEFTRGSV